MVPGTSFRQGTVVYVSYFIFVYMIATFNRVSYLCVIYTKKIVECLIHISPLASEAVGVCVVKDWLWGGIF